MLVGCCPALVSEHQITASHSSSAQCSGLGQRLMLQEWWQPPGMMLGELSPFNYYYEQDHGRKKKSIPASIGCWVRLKATSLLWNGSGCLQLKLGLIHRVLQSRRMFLGVLQPTADHLSHKFLLIPDFFLEAWPDSFEALPDLWMLLQGLSFPFPIWSCFVSCSSGP